MIISKKQYNKLPKRLQKHFRKATNTHPTVKSLKLLEYLVELTKMPNEEQIYLDPFLGSGTTAIAVSNKNRNYIGIEKNEEYCRISRARIKESRRQLQLF